MFKATLNSLTPIFFHHYRQKRYNFVPIIHGLSPPLAVSLGNDTISVDFIHFPSGESLLSFGAESFVFRFAIQNFEG